MSYRGATPVGKGYRGYTIEVDWVLGDHFVYRVYFRGEWVDTFLTLDDVKTTIDDWKVAP